MKYNHKKIESKWHKKWVSEKVYEPDLKNAKNPFYNLMMFPYPSAEGLHVGNMYAFTGSDIYGRFKRMQGYNVFEPIGLDGFGIHSENYALKIGEHPMEQAKVSEKNFYRQLQLIGNGFAWNEKLETYDPEYYKWTQWIFIQLYKKGLAYRKKSAVNWCPSCLTVLADEQVISGECERCGTKVIKKELEQWFFRITKYADKLLKGLDKIDWSEKVKIAQRNWIGKSEGASIKFPLINIPGQKDGKFSVEVFTTRPDTLFGVTYLAVSPELAQKWIDVGWQAPVEVKEYIKNNITPTPYEGRGPEKTGVFSGISAINPANNEKVPVWISDYVLAGYGTGAVMGVPAHDERDFEFAKKYKLPIVEVIRPKDSYKSYFMGGSYEGDLKSSLKDFSFTSNNRGGYFVTFDSFKLKEYVSIVKKHLKKENWCEIIGTKKIFIFGSGEYIEVGDSKSSEEAFGLCKKYYDGVKGNYCLLDMLWNCDFYRDLVCFTGEGIMINSDKFNSQHSEKAGWEIAKVVGGKKQNQFRLRDWLISRQRYWGAPIPMIHCEKCGWQPVPEKDLPVRLPYIKNFRPTGTSQSPLAADENFFRVKCPKCEGMARRETDVSDTFLDSAWYYLRYASVKDKKYAWDQAITKKWCPVDMYIGGAEHSVLHLLYVRFLAMVFKDLRLTNFDEPFKKFRAHGLIIKDGAKMSKSKGNVINPDDYITKYGADALRMYLMFLGPFDQGGDFREGGIKGVTRFLERVWKLFSDGKVKNKKEKAEGTNLNKKIHQTIKKVTEDVESLNYNTAVSALMILLNEIEVVGPTTRENLEIFVKLLSPFSPHITEEIWRETLGNKKSIHVSEWPKYDTAMIKEDEINMVVQINGKTRAIIKISAGLNQDEVEGLVKSNEIVSKYLNESPKKVVFVKDRLINFVV